MYVPGVSGVTPTGAFTYSIPIVVPPGTADMVPSLSLNYSSAAGDGFEGLGWFLSGLYSITRCPLTLAQDGTHGGVNYTAGTGGAVTSDRFCLNGQRLILTAGGHYGTENSVYHTEVENFTEVIAHCDVPGACTTTNGPDWFEVRLRSGIVLQLGNTTGSANYSRILISNPPSGTQVVREWLENNAADPSGNYMTVAYDSALEGYPTDIYYGGHSTSPVVSPYNRVRFAYVTRSTPYKIYQAGSSSTVSVLLSNVYTYANSSLVSNYVLNYTFAASGKAQNNELISITRCSNSAGTSCLAPTTFGWQGSRDTVDLQTPVPESLAQGGILLPGDWNGDGLTDVLFDSAGDDHCNLYIGGQDNAFHESNITATFDDWSTGSSNWVTNVKPCFHDFTTHNATPTPVDFTGDGFTDVIIQQSHGEAGIYIQTIINQANGTLVQASSGSEFLASSLDTGDFNGDGLTDFTVFSPSTGQSLFLNNTTSPGTFLSPTAIAQGTYADFDGDGCTDVMTNPFGSSYFADYSCHPAVAVSPAILLSGTPTFGDFNGDGKTDIIDSNGLHLSTGTGFAAALPVPSAFSQSGSYSLVVGDFNGDGKDDIAIISAVAGSDGVTSTIYLSTGSSFVQAKDTHGNPISLSGFGSAVIADWNNDGADDIWFQQAAGDELYFINYVPELINSVSNGLCASPCSTTTVTYDRLNHGTIYTKGTGASYPTQDVINSSYVVSSVSSNNGVGGSNSINYTYAGAKQDLQGRGFLGFSTVKTTDNRTGISTTTSYNTLYPLTGTPSRQVIAHGSTTLSDIRYTFTPTAEGLRYLVELTETDQVTRNDLDGTAMPTVDITYTYDTYGNPYVTTKTISYGGSTSSTTTQTTTWTNTDTSSLWILGQPLTRETKNVVGSSPQLDKTWSFTTDHSTGLITETVIEPGTSIELDIDYTSDPFGNRHTIKQSGSDITTRTTVLDHDSQGQFLTEIKYETPSSGVAQTESFTFDARFGRLTTHTDVNGQMTSLAYDTFGRVSTLVNPDLTGTQVAYNYCSGINGGTTSCGTHGAYWIDTTPVLCSDAACDSVSTIGPYLNAEQDQLQRPILIYTQGFSGSLIKQSTTYDAQLHVFETSRPIFDSGSYAYTKHYYDALDRLTESDFPDGSTTTQAYSGLTSSVTNDLSQKTTTVLTPQGWVASVGRSVSYTTSFSYNSLGYPLVITAPGGHTITNTYDVRGRKKSSLDNDLGTNAWVYTYDVLSELLTQKDSIGNTTTISYDVLGRPTSRIEADMTSTWNWDTATNGVGKLAEACNAASCSSATYSYTPTYDTLGRPVLDQLQINGTTYHYGLGYDADGRLNHVTYPSGLRVARAYTSLSYLSSLTDHVAGSTVWTANAADAELHLTQATAGNGIITSNGFDLNTGNLETIDVGVSGSPHSIGELSYQWDTIGNLTSRQDLKEGYTESFCYDDINRLKTYGLTTSTICPVSASGTVTMDYAINGNISTKSDVGTYNYSATAAGDHAVTSVTGTVEGVTNPNFFYDGNGNMHCMTTGSDCGTPYSRRIDWTSFNMVAQVYDHTTGNYFGFVYDTNHSRIEQCTPTCANPTSTLFYLTDPTTGALEETTVQGANTTTNDYISANGSIVAVRNLALGVTMYQYLNGDHLGSVTFITNASGGLVGGRQSYDAWGLRRLNTGVPAASCSAVTSASTRGYTAQEELDSSCLVDLNARVYEPTLGRMLSADPTVPDALNTQAYNRYSYVLNNPLALTDPTGYDGVCGSTYTDANGVENVVVCPAPNDSPSIQSVSGPDTLGIGRGIPDFRSLARQLANLPPCKAAAVLATATQLGPAGNYFSTSGGSAIMGLGFSYSTTIYANNVTGETGFFRTFSFGVGALIGLSVEFGYSPSVTGTALMNTQSSISAAVPLDASGTGYFDSDGNLVATTFGGGTGMKLGLAAEGSIPDTIPSQSPTKCN